MRKIHPDCFRGIPQKELSVSTLSTVVQNTSPNTNTKVLKPLIFLHGIAVV